MLHFSCPPRAGLGATIQVAGVSGASDLTSTSDNVGRAYPPRGLGGGREMPTSLPRRLQGPLAGAPATPPGPREGGATPAAGWGWRDGPELPRVPAPPSHLQKGTLSSG